MIQKIQRQIIFNGRQGNVTWFHPKACVIPNQPKPTALLTCQSITGSDYFGQVFFATSNDNGNTWTEPVPIPGLGRQQLAQGIEEGVCDVVPQYHRQTDTVLAIGHNVYYKAGKLTLPTRMRHPMYVVRNANGEWSGRRKLDWDDPRGNRIYTSGCGQRLHRDDGTMLLPISFAPMNQKDRMVGSLQCEFDGERISVLNSGNALHLPVDRGLLEPSLTFFENRYLLTIRAEDGHGYYSISDDGLHWAEQQPWCWDNGEALTMSTTQQHWLRHRRALFLVYTRQAVENRALFRWRAPLYVAQVNPHTMQLIHDTEQIIFPIIGDAQQDPKKVALMGNFHITEVSPQESWITVGESLPWTGWRGDTLLARIYWTK